MAQPNAKWYDTATLEEMHADLKVEYLKTLAVITNRPQLLKHFNSCTVCQTIKNAQEPAEPPGTVQIEAHRRRKLSLTYSQLHALLGLKPEHSIVALEIRQDPVTLSIVITGPNEPLTPVYQESPVTVVNVEAA